MPKINVLDKHIAELIAAGEVVERPASVIKELLENSIDAGATAITIEIKNGGINYIRVTDNGCGIDKSDVSIAFLRHATSKICSASDLDSIFSLGFRGEALASISAVSKVTLITRTENNELGVRYVGNGGEELYIEDVGAPVGTTITVSDLFYNTPARMKFLKKDVSEGNAVAAIVERIALSHAEISFKFVREGKNTILTPGDNKAISAIRAVLGKEFASGLIEVDYSYKNINVKGYICKPLAARGNRNLQHFFINERYIKSKTAIVALDEAYKNSIAVGKFPSCVLYISIDASLVDVNVHPAKIEVRFANERELFDAIYYAVKSSLSTSDTMPNIVLNSSENNTNGTRRVYSQPEPIKEQIRFENTASSLSLRQTSSAYGGIKIQDANYKPTVVETTKSENTCLNESEITKKAQKPNENIDILDKDGKNDYENPLSVLNIKVIGEVFFAYILAELGDDLILIDKHAAHERLIFNKIKNNALPRQTLLTPITITLDIIEHEVLLENMDMLLKYGIELEDFGRNTVLVRAVPSALPEKNMVSLIEEIAQLLLKNSRHIETQSMQWLYNSIACRAAIKAGSYTSIQELTKLVHDVFEYEDIRYCPHGRPVAYKLTKSEIEKYFLRG